MRLRKIWGDLAEINELIEVHHIVQVYHIVPLSRASVSTYAVHRTKRIFGEKFYLDKRKLEFETNTYMRRAFLKTTVTHSTTRSTEKLWLPKLISEGHQVTKGRTSLQD